MEWLIANQNKFPREHLNDIKSSLDRMSPNNQMYVQSQTYNDPILLLIISILLGTFGIDRFLIGQMGLGILKLITLGGGGIWTVIDWFLIMDATKKENFRKLVTFLK